MGSPTTGEITRLLQAWRAGDQRAVDELWPALYDELRRLARAILRGRRVGDRERPTSLVHEAYLRLLGADVEWRDRRHFLAVAARAMRFVLADEARRQLARKRGGGGPAALHHGLEMEVEDPLTQRPEEVLAIHRALRKLAAINPRQTRLVELRYFLGLSVEEIAEILELTPRTVVRDWRSVRIWLHGELSR